MRAREIAAAARDVPLPAHARGLPDEMFVTLDDDDLAALVDRVEPPEE